MWNLDGYIYRYEGRRNWRASSDERWEIVCQRVDDVACIGARLVDGSHQNVWRAADGTIYAARPGFELEGVRSGSLGRRSPSKESEAT